MLAVHAQLVPSSSILAVFPSLTAPASVFRLFPAASGGLHLSVAESLDPSISILVLWLAVPSSHAHPLLSNLAVCSQFLSYTSQSVVFLLRHQHPSAVEFIAILLSLTLLDSA